VIVFDEFLDFPRFSGPEFSRTFATYLRRKYSPRPPEVIIAAGDAALDFLLRNRSELYSQVPIVQFAVRRSHLASIPRLPADVIGVSRAGFPGELRV